jgi:hypothetical protein
MASWAQGHRTQGHRTHGTWYRAQGHRDTRTCSAPGGALPNTAVPASTSTVPSPTVPTRGAWRGSGSTCVGTTTADAATPAWTPKRGRVGGASATVQPGGREQVGRSRVLLLLLVLMVRRCVWRVGGGGRVCGLGLKLGLGLCNGVCEGLR